VLNAMATQDKNIILKIENLSFSYDTKKGDYEVFKDINLDIYDNEFFCVVGSSGCGKTTLLNVIAGFETPKQGNIYVNGESIIGKVSHERAVVFQQDAVFPWLTVFKNIEFGPKVRKVLKSERIKKVNELIKFVGLNGFENSYPRELSGGMRKRVDLGRALINDPEILLMDEPFGSLDALTKEKMQIELMNIMRTTKKTVVFITHDLEEALFLGDRICIMPKITSGLPMKVVNVPYKRPRDIDIKANSDFQYMRQSILKEFKFI